MTGVPTAGWSGASYEISDGGKSISLSEIRFESSFGLKYPSDAKSSSYAKGSLENGETGANVI